LRPIGFLTGQIRSLNKETAHAYCGFKEVTFSGAAFEVNAKKFFAIKDSSKSS